MWFRQPGGLRAAAQRAAPPSFGSGFAGLGCNITLSAPEPSSGHEKWILHAPQSPQPHDGIASLPQKEGSSSKYRSLREINPPSPWKSSRQATQILPMGSAGRPRQFQILFPGPRDDFRSAGKFRVQFMAGGGPPMREIHFLHSGKAWAICFGGLNKCFSRFSASTPVFVPPHGLEWQNYEDGTPRFYHS